MTVYTVITAAIVRKLRALVAEIRTLVAVATTRERHIVSMAEEDAKRIVLKAEYEVKVLKEDLVDAISKM